ncbi:hypothetical protein ACFL3S_10545 [Gemmatimonadota bacterium]
MRRLVMRISPALVVVFVLWATACNEVPTDPTAEPGAPQFAKGGSKGRPSADPEITFLFADDGNGIRSDGRSIYEEDGCSVARARFNLEDAILQIGTIKKKDQAACGDRRYIHVEFPGVSAYEGAPDTKKDWVGPMYFVNIDHVENVLIADGSVARKASVGFMTCPLGLKFDSQQSTPEFAVNDVEVTQTGGNTWNVRTRPYPDNVAVCVSNEEPEYYHMSFDLTVTLKE